MKTAITPVMWLIVRTRREQSRTGVIPVSHRPNEVALRQSMSRHPAGKHAHGHVRGGQR